MKDLSEDSDNASGGIAYDSIAIPGKASRCYLYHTMFKPIYGGSGWR